MRWVIGILFAVGLGVGLAGPVAAEGEDARVIVVTGEGRASAPPDMVELRFGVTAQETRAAQAMDRVSKDVRAVFAQIEAAGVDPRDVQTTALRLDPVWSNRSSNSGQPPEITGFVATNEVLLRLRDMTALGRVLQDILDAGANRFSSIRFTLSDPAPLREQARRAAVADARAKAVLYAEAAGVELEAVLSLVESGASAPRPEMMASARMAMDSGVPIAGGALDLTARVTVTYGIK